MEKKKVIIGLSGGVDSSVAAYLLKEQGYEVIGVTMEIWQDNDKNENPAVTDAKKVAQSLGIEYHVVDFKDIFEKSVVKNFVDEYMSGRTPNPCVLCNRVVKWEALLDKCDSFSADYIATGHYSRIEKLDNGRYAIKKSVNDAKDQTYALYGLSQKQLKRTLMPVGAYTKEEIRSIACRLGLDTANKPDSMEICFISDNDYAKFIKERTGAEIKPGNFVDINGNVVGRHKGIIHYTVGQRKGLGLSLGYPVFVVEIRPDTNEVVVGENKDVFKDRLIASDVKHMSVPKFEKGKKYIGKIRYNHKGTSCIVNYIDDNRIECIFDEPVRAVTKGQAVVLYDGDYVAGGGIIEE